MFNFTESGFVCRLRVYIFVMSSHHEHNTQKTEKELKCRFDVEQSHLGDTYIHPHTHTDYIYVRPNMDPKRYQRCGDCMPCTRDNYVRTYVTEAKDRDKMLALGPRECENPKDITKRVKLSKSPKSPCKCGCFHLMPPPKPAMKIDYARQAANELAEKRKKIQEDALTRVREEIIQHDNDGTGHFRVSETLLIQSHKARVRIHFSTMLARAVTQPVRDFRLLRCKMN